MNMEEDREFIVIGVVADLLKIHPQTLRLYERRGLVRPSRSKGNTRLYSKENIRQIVLIQRLTTELGVNLAGVEVILNMREALKKLEKQNYEFIESFYNKIEEELSKLSDPNLKNVLDSFLISVLRDIKVINNEVEDNPIFLDKKV
jgi:MerR family transcriptional regulator, heat shock protein HspR